MLFVTTDHKRNMATTVKCSYSAIVKRQEYMEEV